jgi:tryptophan synthase beta chain
MPSYDAYINGDLRNYEVTNDEIDKYLANVPQVGMDNM